MYKIGDIVETKKPHVCGSNAWKIIRAGADYKLECVGCQRVILMAKFELDKKIKNRQKISE